MRELAHDVTGVNAEFFFEVEQSTMEHLATSRADFQFRVLLFNNKNIRRVYHSILSTSQLFLLSQCSIRPQMASVSKIKNLTQQQHHQQLGKNIFLALHFDNPTHPTQFYSYKKGSYLQLECLERS